MRAETRPARWLRVGPYLATAAILTFLWRPVLFAGELIESGDLLTPLTMRALRRMFWPFWNRTLEFPNVETVDRLAWMAPFLLLPSPLLAQNLMFAAALLGAGVSMLYAAKRLGATTLLAVLAAVLFAYNPFVAVRLQHYFQLPGYAVLPAVVALWLKPYPRRTPFVLALLLTLGSTTPHYTVYLWSLGALWLVFYFSPAALKRFAATLGLYVLFNLYWLVPTAAFTSAADLVPSRPTWELLELFSRHATPAAVARLQGYWWPLADTPVAPVTAWLGFGLLAAALLTLARPGRDRLFLATGALVYGLVALGTNIPFLASFLSLESPVADRLGWLFRDPAKAVGPLAALLFLLAAVGLRGGSRRVSKKPNALAGALSFFLLAAYGVFAFSVTGPYLRAVYQPHAPPAAFSQANEWLEGKDGRVLWVPQYYGATTFWNGDNLTPEFPTHSSALPVLGPYGYDGRSVVSYLSLYFGVLLRRTDADLGKVLRAWGTRWLVHHRDLPPYRLQPESAFDNQVELLQPSLASQDLEETVTFSPLSIYDAGAPVGAYLPGRVSVTDNPVAALVTLSNWSTYAPEHWSFVEAPHRGVQDVTLAPGGDARVVLAAGYPLDLAQATVHYDPERSWSRLGETTLEWWPNALTVGLPADERVTLLMTRAPGAQVEVPMNAPAGAYRLLVRVYKGPEAGAVRLGLGTNTYTVELFAPSLRSTWLDLGELDPGALDLGALNPALTLTNLEGFNVLAEVKLVPVAAWKAAQTALAGLGQTWLWPSSTLCRDLRPSEAAPVTVSAGERDLPFAQTFVGASLWNDYQTVTLEVYGDGQDRPVELWTQVEDTWLFLGGTRTWWRGWRTVHLPVRAQDFVFVASGSFSPADNLKFVTPESGGGAALRVREVRLTSSPNCSLQFSSSRDAEATLDVALERPVTLSLNGRPLAATDNAAQTVPVRTGLNTLTLPLADAAAVRGIVVTTGPPPFDEPGPVVTNASTGTELSCMDTWHLAVTEPFYLLGKVGWVDGSRLEATPVNYLRAGYWVPPGRCGTLNVRNRWVSLGWVSLAASLLSFAVVLTWNGMRWRSSRRPPEVRR